MNRSKPGLPVHHQLPELAQTHIHQVGDSIQPSHYLSSPSLTLNLLRVFSNESVLHIRWLKYWSFSFSISPFNEYSGLISLRIYWFDSSVKKTQRNHYVCPLGGTRTLPPRPHCCSLAAPTLSLHPLPPFPD